MRFTLASLVVMCCRALQNDSCDSIHGMQCSDADIGYTTGVWSHEECCQTCQGHAGCAAWSWNFVDGHCHIHSACSQTTNPNYHSGISSVPSPPSPPGPPAPASQICVNKVGLGTEESIWRKLGSHPSCRGEFKSEGFGMCSGDPTSITLDMRSVQSKQGCYAYGSSQKLTWKMTELKKIVFDVEWEDCEQVWTAPLWLTPAKWVKPQGLSGEIDVLETCKKHQRETVGTSIICRDHPDPECFEPQWGEAKSSNGPLHMSANIDEDGTWTMHKCNLDGSNCQLVSRYPRYLEKIHNANQAFSFMSDLYNGGAGDSGWKACGTLNHNTQCRYTIANIYVQKKGDPPAPPPPPSPTPPSPPSPTPPSPPSPPSPSPPSSGQCCFGGCSGSCQGGWCGQSQANCEANCNGKWCPSQSHVVV